MGSGADTSEVPLLPVSICSTVDTSMGWSTKLPWDGRDGPPVSKGPRGQQSPPANFNGLKEKVLVLFLRGSLEDKLGHRNSQMFHRPLT